MRDIMLTVMLGSACTIILAGRPAVAQRADKSDEVNRLEAELARLRGQIHTVEARLRKAREVVVAFTVQSERSLGDPKFEGVLQILTMQNRKWGQCVVSGPDLVIAVNKEAKTIFVKGQPEDIESFKSLVLSMDALYKLGENRNR
jgi:hypothetical protein